MPDESLLADEQTLRVRDGELAGRAPWVYVWLKGGEVVHVGATDLPPAVRTWLHLHHEDPEIGRVRARRPDALAGEVLVRAFRLRDGLDRQAVKRALARLCAGEPAEDDDAPQRAAAAIFGAIR